MQITRKPFSAYTVQGTTRSPSSRSVYNWVEKPDNFLNNWLNRRAYGLFPSCVSSIGAGSSIKRINQFNTCTVIGENLSNKLCIALSGRACILPCSFELDSLIRLLKPQLLVRINVELSNVIKTSAIAVPLVRRRYAADPGYNKIAYIRILDLFDALRGPTCSARGADYHQF